MSNRQPRRRRGETEESLLMRRLFFRLDAVRSVCVERCVDKSDAKTRRQWAARLPDEIAFLEEIFTGALSASAPGPRIGSS
jgi:hypothetical protein